MKMMELTVNIDQFSKFFPFLFEFDYLVIPFSYMKILTGISRKIANIVKRRVLC
jgi:hypothetical protein